MLGSTIRTVLLHPRLGPGVETNQTDLGLLRGSSTCNNLRRSFACMLDGYLGYSVFRRLLYRVPRWFKP